MAAPGPAEPGPASGEIAVGMAARLLMISAERVRQLSAQGYIPIPRRGVTTIVGAVQGYIRFLKEDARRAARSALANRTTDARAREIEQRVAMRSGGLIARADAEAAVDILAGLFEQGVDRFRARAARMGGDTAAIDETCADVADRVRGGHAEALRFLATGVDRDPDA